MSGTTNMDKGECWWMLRVNGTEFTRVWGRARAEWFREQMWDLAPSATWELTPWFEQEPATPVSPEAVFNRLERHYCVGSD